MLPEIPLDLATRNYVENRVRILRQKFQSDLQGSFPYHKGFNHYIETAAELENLFKEMRAELSRRLYQTRLALDADSQS